MNTTGPCRALIARGLQTAIILATDNAALAWEVENISSDDADEVLGDWFCPQPIGLYLFEGQGQWTTHNTLDGPSDPELEWTGTVRRVISNELSDLWAMEPPEEER